MACAQLAVLKKQVSRLVDSVDEIRRKFKESGNEAELEQTIEYASDGSGLIFRISNKRKDEKCRRHFLSTIGLRI